MAFGGGRMTMTQPLTGMVAPDAPTGMSTGTPAPMTRMQMPGVGTPQMAPQAMAPAGLAPQQTMAAQAQQMMPGGGDPNAGNPMQMAIQRMAQMRQQQQPDIMQKILGMIGPNSVPGGLQGMLGQLMQPRSATLGAGGPQQPLAAPQLGPTVPGV